jgi:tRNA(Arg) A34 adenosine deaminase TadA
MSDEDYMRLAIQKTREGIAAGQSPFGAVIVRAGQVLAAAHNTVLRDSDPTAHAEVNAIRQAATVLQDISLGGCTLFSTCEPCPMCLAAIHWAKIDRVLFGANISDATAAGFSALNVPARELARLGGSRLQVEVGPLRQECRDLVVAWQTSGLARQY